MRITFAYALAEEGDRRAVAEETAVPACCAFLEGRCLPPTVFRPVQLYPGGLGGNETMTHQKF